MGANRMSVQKVDKKHYNSQIINMALVKLLIKSSHAIDTTVLVFKPEVMIWRKKSLKDRFVTANNSNNTANVAQMAYFAVAALRFSENHKIKCNQGVVFLI